MMGWYDDGWSYGWMFAMMLGWVALIALAVWAVVALTRRSGPARGPPAPQQPPWQTLDGRFAAGEISQQEYLEARQLLDDGAGRPERSSSA